MSIPLVEWEQHVRDAEAAALAPREPLKKRLVRALVGYIVLAACVVLLRLA